MDDEALRAMMPMAFGKAPRRQPAAAKEAAPAAATPKLTGIAYESPTALALAANRAVAAAQAQASSSRSAPIGPARPAPPSDDDEEDLDDDGLTPAERAANEEAERRAAAGEQSDGDDDDEDALGPEPMSGPRSGDNDGFPISQSVMLRDHEKTVSAMSIDSSGSRLATGSYDYAVKLWDFGGMTSSFRPFRSFEPSGSYWVHDVLFAPPSEQLLVISGTNTPKLFDRDGIELLTFAKGDVYIRDMKNTKGHVAEITCAAWHPLEFGVFVTGSADSSVRIWSTAEHTQQSKVIAIKSKQRGARTKVTSMAYSHDAKWLIVGCLDGALHLYRTGGNYVKSDATSEGAHEPGTAISSVIFSKDGKLVVSRGCDGTLKTWDARRLKPIAAREGLPNLYDQTSVIFSADERSILTGTSLQREATTEEEMVEGRLGRIIASGAIEVMARDDLAPIRRIAVGGDDPTSVVKLQWNTKINQLFASTSAGFVQVFYDPAASTHGALLCIGKKGKGRSAEQAYLDAMPVVVAQEGDNRGMGTSLAAKKRRLEKARQDSKATRMPDRPMEGRGKGGRIGAAATAHVVQAMFPDNTRLEDPRAELLKYADTKQDPKWTKAWAANQPKTLYAEEEDDAGEQEEQ